MNRVGTSVDMTLPEARKFRESWEDLRDEFQAFMSLVPLSNATQLVELAGQAKEFAEKLDALPPVRRRRAPERTEQSQQQPPDASVAAGITA